MKRLVGILLAVFVFVSLVSPVAPAYAATSMSKMVIYLEGGNLNNYIGDEYDDSGFYPTFLYTGKAVKPEVVVFDGTKTIAAKNYTVSYWNNTKAGTATVTIKGKGSYTGTVKKKFKIVKSHNAPITRIFGTSRYETSTTIAKVYQTLWYGNKKMKGIIVTSGENFPDGITGGAFAKEKEIPILNWRKGENKQVQEFIKANVAKNGTVYILGGPSAVSDDIKKGMTGYKFKRLGGQNRYGTNLEILKSVKNPLKQLILCDGNNWENALIASSTTTPIMLLDKNGFNTAQRAFLKNKRDWLFVPMGNENSVKKAEAELQREGRRLSRRLTSTTADAMSVEFAKLFYPNPKTFYIAKAGMAKTREKDFADGLCGGAFAFNGPIFLVGPKNPKIDAYIKSLTVINEVVVFGGTLAVSDSVARKIAKNSKEKILEVENLLK